MAAVIAGESEHIESEIALKPEHVCGERDDRKRAYRIGDRAQAGTHGFIMELPPESISNRRSRSSRNYSRPTPAAASEHIESEIALKPERKWMRW